MTVSNPYLVCVKCLDDVDPDGSDGYVHHDNDALEAVRAVQGMPPCGDVTEVKSECETWTGKSGCRCQRVYGIVPHRIVQEHDGRLSRNPIEQITARKA